MTMQVVIDGIVLWVLAVVLWLLVAVLIFLPLYAFGRDTVNQGVR